MNFTHIITTGLHRFPIHHDGDHIFFFHNISLDLTIDIAHQDAKVYIFGLFTGKEREQFHLTTRQHHTTPGGYSDLLIKGVFDDASSLDYSGDIKIDQDCNGAHAYQKNQNILLSPRARVTSEPNLEILSPDVFCTHGSTTGTVNAETIHYLRTRGLSLQDAQNLTVEGFIQDLVTRVQHLHPSFVLPQV